MNSFSKNVIIVSLGPLVASIVSFIAEPWISRYWPPDVYGGVSYFNSFILILAPAMFLRYNNAMIQSKSVEEESNLMALSAFLMVGGMILLFFLFPIFSSYFSTDFSFDNYKLLFFTAVFFSAINVLFRFWATSKKMFYHITISTILLQISFTILLLIFGYLGKNNLDIIIYIRTFSYILCPVVLIIAFFKNDFKSLIKLISYKKMVLMAKRYKRFPKIELWGFISGVAAFNIPIIIITLYWGQEMNGLYSKAFYIVYMFVLFIGDSISRVLHKEIADITNKNQTIDTLLITIVKNLVAFTILPFSILILAGPEIFSIFLGAQWIQSGVFAQLISIWMFAHIISLAVSPVFSVLNKQQYYTIFQVLTLFIRAVVLIVLGKMQVSIFTSVFIFSLINVVVIVIQTITALRLAGVYYNKPMVAIFKPVLQIIPFFAVFYLVQWLITPLPVMVLLIVTLLSLPYIYLYYLKGNSLLKQLMHSYHR